jgi:hypothetical protein
VISVPIHNQCSDFELTSPVYFGRNSIWIRPLDQKVDANAMTRASFGEEMFATEFASTLLYKLQRKKPPESNNQSDANSASTKNLLTSLQLLIIWRYNVEHKLSARALLIKHSNTIAWDEDTLERLYSMHLALLRNYQIIEDTWLLDDATILMITLKGKKDSYGFEIIISEGTRTDDTMEPLWVSLNM